MVDGVCFIEEVPFRGCNCTDAAGREFAYKEVIKMLGEDDILSTFVLKDCLPDKSKDGRVWDEVSKTPHFNYVEEATNTSYQVWYDDPESLGIKYRIAEDMGLGGVGFWTGNYLDYGNKTMVEDMWSVVPSSRHRSGNVEINAK